jgi:hypothetical protein
MSARTQDPGGVYGIAARFDGPGELLAAVRAARAAGYAEMDAYSPYPIHEMDDALGVKRTILPWLVLGAGLAGGIGGFLMQYWMVGVSYPLNIGGKPYFSWPQFIPVTFECAVLLAGLTAAFGMFALNGFPRPHHPIFNAKGFEEVTSGAFFLCIESSDPKFDRDATMKFLQSLKPREVSEVDY